MKWSTFNIHMLSLMLGSLQASSWAAESPKKAYPIRKPRSLSSDSPPPLDNSALWAKKRAAQTLIDTFKANPNSPQAPSLLLNYCEIIQQIAGIQYRISSKKGTSTAEYQSTLLSSVKPLTLLITKFPHMANIQRAIYLRGKAYMETSHKQAAINDFQYIINKWPSYSEAKLASVSLWDLLMEKKDYQGVIDHVRRFQMQPNEKIFSIALERLEWAYLYLNNIPAALESAVRLLKYRKDQDEQEREKAIINFSLFYATGVANKVPGISSSGMVSYFKNHLSGSELELAILEYARVLRGKGLETELDEIPTLIAREQLNDICRFDLLMLIFENQMNSHRILQLKDTTNAIIQLTKKSDQIRNDTKRISHLQSIFTDATKALQQLILKWSNAQTTPAYQAVSNTLISLYRFNSSEIADEETKIKVQYNLGELYFQTKDYSSAASSFKTVVENTSPKNPKQSDLFQKAGLKSIESQYLLLKQKNIVPHNLTPHPLSAPEKDLPKEVDQWIASLDEYIKHIPLNNASDSYFFDAARTLYSYGQTKYALERLSDLVTNYPASRYTFGAISLILDTYVASEQWPKVFSTSSTYLSNPALQKSAEIQKRLSDIQTDSYYKILETSYKNNDFKNTLSNGDKFLALHPNTKRKPEFLELLGNAAIGAGDRKRSLQYFSLLRATGTIRSEAEITAAIAAASLAEENYQFGEAVTQYLQYLTLNSSKQQNSLKDLNAIRFKTLLYAWFTANPTILQKAIQTPSLCSSQDSSVTAACDRSKARLALMTVQPNTNSNVEKLANAGNRDSAIYAVAAIKNPKVSLDSKLSLIKIISNHWDDLDSLTQFNLLPSVNTVASDLLIQFRNQARTIKVKLDKEVIKTRVSFLEQAEDKISMISNLPSTQIKLYSMWTASELYSDLSSDIQALPAPDGVTGADLDTYKNTLNEVRSPFNQKSDELKNQALNLASQTGIDTLSLSNSGETGSKVPYFNVRSKISFDLLNSSDTKKTPELLALLRELKTALDQKNWPKSAFLVQEAKRLGDQDKVNKDDLILMKAILLNSVGMTPEALSAIKEMKDLNDTLHFIIFAGYCNAGAKEKAKSVFEKLPREASPSDSQWFTAASEWIKAEGQTKNGGEK